MSDGLHDAFTGEWGFEDDSDELDELDELELLLLDEELHQNKRVF